MRRVLAFHPPESDDCFSIRSFGSWDEASVLTLRLAPSVTVSVSALSDRGMRRGVSGLGAHLVQEFQYPLFRIVG